MSTVVFIYYPPVIYRLFEFSYIDMDDDFLLPNVLLGDLFVLVMNRSAEEIAEEERKLLDQLPTALEPLTAKPSRTLPQLSLSKKLAVSVVPPATSKQSMRLFTCNTYPVGTVPNWGGSVIPVSCDACGVAIRRSSHYMRCCECVKPMVDLCVMCFANGAEFGDHKRSHSYSVVKNRLGNRKLAKLDVFDFLNFLSASADKGCLNFSEFEKSVLHFFENDNGAGRISSNAGRRFGGRGVRSNGEVTESTIPSEGTKNIKQTTDAEKIYLSVINMLTGCREELSVDELVAGVGDGPASILPGPANYNTLREEFEFEYLPEAETILAAVSPNLTTELTTLLEGYNGILDERERRKRTLVAAGLTTVKEFTATSSQKKRKTDEKDSFEKSRIFLRAVSDSLDIGKGSSILSSKRSQQSVGDQPSANTSSPSVKFLDNLGSYITTRKRLIDRLKRLSSLWKHGIHAEDASSIQFDSDKKKRNDLNSAKIKSVTSKVWTYLPNQTDIAGTSARTNRGHLVSDMADGSVDPLAVKISPIDIFQSLPGGIDLSVKNPAALQLCLELYIAPQQFLVVQSAIHAMIKSDSTVPDSKLIAVIRDGIFGTTKRYMQGGGGPQSSVQNNTIDQMKAALIQCCKDSFSR